MILRLIAALMIVVMTDVADVRGGEFQAAAAIRSITPNPLLPVSGGVGEPNTVTGKLGELTARVMVFSDGSTTIAVVGIDVLGFTNDAFGYILTKVDFDSFDRYAYVSRTSLGEMTGEILMENVLEMIKSAGK